MGEPTSDDGAAKPATQPSGGPSPSAAEDRADGAGLNQPEGRAVNESAWRSLALRMVREQLESRGIRDRRVLDAMAEVPRHQFVGRMALRDAYSDRALPTLEGQTISQPYMVAVMTELLRAEPGMWVLEIGTGSGYQAAILAEMGCRVVTVERVVALARAAGRRLEKLGYADRVRVVEGDGSAGLPAEGVQRNREGESAAEQAPPVDRRQTAGPACQRQGDSPTPPETFNRILVTASAPAFHPALARLLADGGRAIVPVGSRQDQELHIIEKRAGTIMTSTCVPCRFVPLIGPGGWPAVEE